MNRKYLEMSLSQSVVSFQSPIIELEQYQTPPNVVANIIHAAYMNGDIKGKDVVDICAGTGILGIAAGLLGARSITFVEKETDALRLLKSNIQKNNLKSIATVINSDALEWETEKRYHTAVLNPPFGIQQKKVRDTDFLHVALSISNIIYSIHDGSPANEKFLPEYVKKQGGRPLGYFKETFTIPKVYEFHTDKLRLINVIVLHSTSNLE